MTAADDRLLASDAAQVELDDLELSPDDVVAGEPRTFAASLVESGGVDLGLWEITPGTVTDTEADEVFVVLSGRGEVAFDDGSTITLGPGTVVHLRAGDRTTWTITETLRKVYVVLPA